MTGMPFLPMLASILLSGQAFDSSSLPREVGMVPDEAVKVRAGTAFFTHEVLGVLLDAEAAYSAKTGEVWIDNGRHRLFMRVGSRSMTIDGHTRDLGAELFARGESAMIPIRAVARALGRTIEYERATESLLIPTSSNKRVRCIPLPSSRPGIVIASVSRGVGQGSEVRVQLQANVPKGRLVVQLRDASGKAFLESEAQGYGGRYGEILVFMGKRDELGDRYAASVVAFVRLPEGTTTPEISAKA